ncbi:MAG: peptidyl-prolyl cis-trans isomerase [Candidatus Aminicenantales bacterium]
MYYNDLNLKKMNECKQKPANYFLLPGVLLSVFALWGIRLEASGEHPSLENAISKKKDKVILEIGNSSYSSSDFDNYVHSIIGEEENDLAAPALSRLFDKFVEEKLLLKRAQDQKIILTEEEKKIYLSKLKSEFWAEGGRKASWASNPKALHEKLIVEKYLYLLIKDLRVEESEIAEYYERHKKGFFQSERVQVSQILLESKGKAIEVFNKLKSSPEMDFRKLAMTESVGPEAFKGGLMGVFSLGQLPFDIEKVVFALREGEISQVVRSSFGFHIFKLDKRYEPKMVALEEAAPAIKTKILEQKISRTIFDRLEQLKKTMPWKSYIQNLSFPYQRNNA